jgi:hypothetical protein
MNGVLTLDETFSPESWDAREQCWVDVHVRTDLAGDDEFRIDYQTSGGTWYPMKLWTGDVDEHAVLTPSLHGYPRLRLSLSASAASAGRAGAQIDELKVLCSGENMTAGGWEPISGTSASTPFVSGVAALVRSARPELEAAGVKAALMCGAQPITSLAGTSVSGARLDARGAIDAGLLPGAPRSSARLESQGFTSADYPTGVAEHPGGGYVVALSEQHKLVRVFADGRREVIAGTGENASSGDGGPATAAALARPGFVAVRQDGSILFTEWSRIREIDTKGTIRTLAGNGGFNYVPDGAQATSGSIATPEALLADADGGFTFTQSFSPQGRVRRVDADGVIHTVAGGGAAAPVEGGPAKGVQLRDPFGLARLADGSLLVSERTGHRIRRIAPDGTLHTWAGDGIPGISGDGGPRSAARLAYPRALATSDDGTVYAMASVVRAFTPDGRVERVAGGLHGSPAGVDGVPALDASLEVRAVSVVGGRVFLSAHSLFTLSQEREPYAPYPPTCADPREPSPDPDPAPSPSPSPDPSPDPSPSPTTPPSHSPSPEPEGPPAPPARSPFGQLTPPVAVPEPGKVTEALRLGVRVQPASSRTAQRRGLRIAISCTPACHVRIAATVNGRRIASTAPLRPSGRRAMRLKLPRARARTRVRLSVSAVTVAGAQANRVVTTVLR